MTNHTWRRKGAERVHKRVRRAADHFYEYPSVHMVKRHYGMVTKEFKLIHFYYDVDEWELYDLNKDPQEMMNVYNDPAYAETVVQLRKELKELRVKYKDSHELDQKFINKSYEGIEN